MSVPSSTKLMNSSCSCYSSASTLPKLSPMMKMLLLLLQKDLSMAMEVAVCQDPFRVHPIVAALVRIDAGVPLAAVAVVAVFLVNSSYVT